MSLWERAILEGYQIWREVMANEGGAVIFADGSLRYEKL